MGAPGMTTALRADTFKNLQLNAGILIKNFTYSSIANAGALKTAIQNIVSGANGALGTLIGATRGGGNFNVTRERRTPEIDGLRYQFVGGEFIDSADAYLATTLVEVNADTLALALGSPKKTGSSPKVTLEMKTMYDPTASTGDYLTNVCWVGDISDGSYVLICLNNALNTADLQFTYTDKGEGTIAVEFHAHQSDFDDYDQAPFEIVVFSPAT